MRTVTREEYPNAERPVFIRWKMGEYDISVNIMLPSAPQVQCNKNGVAQAQLMIDAGHVADFVEDGIYRDDLSNGHVYYPIRSLAVITSRTSDFAKFAIDMAKAVGFSSEQMAELEGICSRLPAFPTVSPSAIETARVGLAGLGDLSKITDPVALNRLADLQSLVRAGGPDVSAEEAPRAGGPGR